MKKLILIGILVIAMFVVAGCGVSVGQAMKDLPGDVQKELELRCKKLAESNKAGKYCFTDCMNWYDRVAISCEDNLECIKTYLKLTDAEEFKKAEDMKCVAYEKRDRRTWYKATGILQEALNKAASILPPACKPKTCETNMCGDVKDGCDGILNCGTCPDGATCANGVCVAPVVPIVPVVSIVPVGVPTVVTCTDHADCPLGLDELQYTWSKRCREGFCIYDVDPVCVGNVHHNLSLDTTGNVLFDDLIMDCAEMTWADHGCYTVPEAEQWGQWDTGCKPCGVVICENVNEESVNVGKLRTPYNPSNGCASLYPDGDWVDTGEVANGAGCS